MLLAKKEKPLRRIQNELSPMPIKANDFVEIEYTGRLKEGDIVFDTTDADVAKAHSLPKAMYGPVVVVVGQGQLLKGLEAQLIGKEPGSYAIELAAEHAFGKKNAKLIQLVPAKKFLEQKIQPVPGLQINIDDMICVVRQVTGGRVMVDFNHPLAGRSVEYSFKVNQVHSDAASKVQAVASNYFAGTGVSAKVDGSTARFFVPAGVRKDSAFLEQKFKTIELVLAFVPEVKKVVFEEEYSVEANAVANAMAESSANAGN